MCPHRRDLLGHPHTYLVRIRCALGQPLFAADGEAARLLALVEQLRVAFDARLFAYLVLKDSFLLLLRHHAEITDHDEPLRERWMRIGGNGVTPLSRVRDRFASLGGFMQTLLQRFSRDWNRRHGSRGHLWSGRYRACLLADDAALLAATVWMEDASLHQPHLVASSAGRRNRSGSPIALAAAPLRVGPGGSIFTGDESPPGLAPPPEAESQAWLDRFGANLSSDDRRAYGAALDGGWALGRPESLSECLSRLGRGAGRGRSRHLRDLGDELGLCGVWG